jgi:hypothetical protein
MPNKPCKGESGKVDQATTCGSFVDHFGDLKQDSNLLVNDFPVIFMADPPGPKTARCLCLDIETETARRDAPALLRELERRRRNFKLLAY